MSSLDRNGWDQLPITVLAYRPRVQGTRIGFVDLEIPPLGLRIKDCVLHRAPVSGAYRVQVPSAVRETADGQAIIRPDGRPAFKAVAGFTSDEARDRFADEVARQIAQRFPDALVSRDQGSLL